MKTTLTVLLVATLVLGVSVAFAGPPVHRVSGGGTVLTPFGLSTYGFIAQIDAAGVVKGQLQVQGDDAETKGHAKITCLTVVGNEAWIGGIWTKMSGDLEDYVDTEFVFWVQDNGQGANAEPDRISSIVLNTPACETPTLNEMNWTNGNVQVK